ncbi:MAG: hypothetical protein N3D73_03195 [Candidatus Diapherotrites archaeon]|nr:hypothetical protein [Candidatus Diapherotrites archaeon]
MYVEYDLFDFLYVKQPSFFAGSPGMIQVNNDSIINLNGLKNTILINNGSSYMEVYININNVFVDQIKLNITIKNEDLNNKSKMYQIISSYITTKLLSDDVLKISIENNNNYFIIKNILGNALIYVFRYFYLIFNDKIHVIKIDYPSIYIHNMFLPYVDVINNKIHFKLIDKNVLSSLISTS